MPAIDPNVLQCVFYLYPTRKAAENGEQLGGTGFFVGIRLEKDPSMGVLYAVTNRHCILTSGSEVVLRLNTLDGGLDYVTTEAKNWKQHPHLYDVAVYPLGLKANYEYNFIPVDSFFLKKETVDANLIFPGDDVFMIGRFITQEGKQQNQPTVRFGNISRMNGETIVDKYGIRQDTFLVEMKSLPGYSGSPVFVYINPTIARPPNFLVPVGGSYSQGRYGPWLLGVDWCHTITSVPVLGGSGDAKEKTGQYVEVNTGMAGVIPAWRLLEILESEELKIMRNGSE